MRRTLALFIFCGGLCVGIKSGASDWTAGVGNWADPANWSAGVPDNSGGWAIANVQNGGVAVVSNVVPHVSEAWAGNFGGAGTILVTNGGVLPVDNWLVVARMCCPSPTVTPLSTLIVNGGTLDKRGDGFVIGDAGGGLGASGQLFVSGSGTVNVTGGWVGIGNGPGQGWVYLQDNAVFNAAGYDFNVGDWGSSKAWCYLKDNATLNVSRFWIGKTDTTAGVLYQTGGAINGTGTAANEWTIGGENSSSGDVYGFYSLAGGTLSSPFNFQLGRYGKGILYQTGGTSSLSGWTALGRYVNSYGIFWLKNGRYEHTGTSTHTIVAEQGRGEFTVGGTGVADFALSLVLGNASSATAILNLNGGALQAPKIERWNGSGYLNFNGGVLRAKTSDATFISGLTDARVYGGNAIFDTAGYDIAVPQALAGATGNGVLSIPVANGGSGYMGPPVVQIDGDGFGATAVAEIDPGQGTVTNIVVTCPGHDYSTVFSVTLLGGGPTAPASAGSAAVGPIISGGVVKNGLGTLTLSGANSYTGPTTVNAGELFFTPSSIGLGSTLVADGAEIGVKLVDANTQLSLGGLTLGGSTGASLNFDLGAFGNPLNAPLAVSGTLVVNGVATINIADSTPQVGEFPLIQYGSRTGSGRFVLGSMPIGVQASLVTNTVNNSINLVIASVNLPRWDGQAGGFWDIGATANWADVATGLPTFYGEGNAALFDDRALGTTTVNVVANVHPGSITVNNTNLAYTFAGTNRISGATGLLKQGTNSLTILNTAANDYTGPNRLSAGTLAVTNLANGGQPSAIGKSSASPTNLVLNGGVLAYNGPSTVVDRGYSLQAAGSGISVQNDLTLTGRLLAGGGSSFAKSGPGRLIYKNTGTNEISGGAFPGYHVVSGAVVFDGSSGVQTNHSQNELWIGGTPDFGASLVLSNTSMKVDSWIGLGRGNGSVGNLSTLSLYDSKLWVGNLGVGWDNNLPGNLARQTLTLSGTSTLTNGGVSNLGEAAGSSASVFLKDNAIYHGGDRLFIGWHNSATGAVTMANSSIMMVNAWLSIGNEGGIGTMTMTDNSKLNVLWDLNITDVDAGEGTFNLQNNAQVEANQIYIGKGVGSTGTWNQSGGVVTARGGGANEFQIGVHAPGVWNQTGGIVNANGNWTSIGRYADGSGVLNISGGVFSHNDAGRLLQVGEQGSGELNVSGNAVVSTVGSSLTIANAGTATGVVNLNGGTIIAKRVIGGAGMSGFNFNGGVLIAGPGANLDFMSGLTSAIIQNGGAFINSSNNTIGINQELMGAGSGGLTKLGAGTLYLNATNTYTGSTVVNAGALGGTGVVAGPLTVSSGAALAPGAPVGGLSVSNSVTLSSGSSTIMELNKSAGTFDKLEALSIAYGGTLVLTNISGALATNDTFKIFSAPAYSGSFTAVVSYSPLQTVTWDTSRLTVDGTVKVTGLVAAGSPSVSASVSADRSTLTIAWPSEYVGWRLLAQTNNLAQGVSVNPLDWGVVSGSTSTNQVLISVDRSKPSGFYKLTAP